jgi:hypothetical protein
MVDPSVAKVYRGKLRRAMEIYTLSYCRQLPDGPRAGMFAGMFIGAYSSLAAVEAAKKRLQQRKGFRVFPEGLYVDRCRLDEDDHTPAAAETSKPVELREVFTLWHVRPLPDGSWRCTLTRMYSSLKKAEAVREHLCDSEEFRDFPSGFRIDCHRLDEEYDDPMFFTAWHAR